MFVGEAPRHWESRSEGVFARRLDELRDLLNVARVYVTDAVKCPAPERPYSSRREPAIHQVDACRMWLAHDIERVAPKMIIPLGATAAWAVVCALGEERKESRTLAGFERQFGPWAVLKEIRVYPLTHPSCIALERWDVWLMDAVERLSVSRSVGG